MTKYRINWLIVFRNLSIMILLVSCISANKQIEYNNIRMEELDHTINITHTQARHSYLSRLNHKVYSYIPTQEKGDTTQSHGKEYLGNFKITHYCACSKCCGPNAQGITASGKKVQEGVTIAVDKKVIPLGSKVYIDGYGERIAQDTGSAIKGNRIDVYVADHDRALQLGVVYKDVWLMKEV